MPTAQAQTAQAQTAQAQTAQTQTAQAQTAQAQTTQAQTAQAQRRNCESSRVRKWDRKGENMCLEGENPPRINSLPSEG